MPPSTERLQQIATMYATHDAELHRVVKRRGSPEHTTVEDACAFAWTQLLSAEHIDLRPPRWQALAWLTTVAIHEAWRLNRIHRKDGPSDPEKIDTLNTHHQRAVAAAHDIAAQHLRLQLVEQLPERPRRFLLRLALGYSYDEIAAAEHASPNTTSKQIARAKRLLRELDHAQGGE